MDNSAFALAARDLLALGYHPIPIMAGSKRPGEHRGGEWRGMKEWERLRDRKPTEFELRHWSGFPGAGIGLVLGSSVGPDHVIAIDVDVTDPDALDELLRQLPHSPMVKRGAKGETRFYRAPKAIRSKPYTRSADKVRLVDLLTGFDARQTVVPPTMHPETERAYVWIAGPVAAQDLPRFSENDLERLEEALEALGWDRHARERPAPDRPSAEPRRPSDEPADMWMEVKETALANLELWVPHLELYGCRRARGGYEAVATWRGSSTGRPVEQRKRNLSIQPNGIKDFGTNETYSAIDLVMVARGCAQAEATSWLKVNLGMISDNVITADFNVSRRVSDTGTSPGSSLAIAPAPDPVADILARPFVWRDPASIPQRAFIYGQHFIRQFISCTFAPGGVGKSALGLAEAAAMASGKPLLGTAPKERLRVWVWSGEDPLEETERRLAAIMLHYRLSRADLEGWLFLGSGRETEMVIGHQTRDGAVIRAPNVERVVRVMRSHKIDVAVIDPFVSTHRVTENDNNAIDLVAKEWAKIAGETGAAIDLVHHTSKPQGAAEMQVEHGRGASALLYASRSARVLNVMSEGEAAKAGVERRRSYFRVDNGKANLAPPPDRSDWFRFESVPLGNGGLEGGDQIGVVTPWEWPDPFKGVPVEILVKVQERVQLGAYRANVRASDWVGHLVGEVMELDMNNPKNLARVKEILAMWFENGVLSTEMRQASNRHLAPFVCKGKDVEK